jgi:hypothetical protein
VSRLPLTPNGFLSPVLILHAQRNAVAVPNSARKCGAAEGPKCLLDAIKWTACKHLCSEIWADSNTPDPGNPLRTPPEF